MLSVEERDKGDSEKLFDYAKKRFGTTNDLREGGYILPDGTILDFSGRHQYDGDGSLMNGQRYVDHREVASNLNYDENDNETGFNTSMSDFIDRGAIRINASNGWGSINLKQKPTDAQREVLGRLIRRSDGNVDVDFGNGDSTDHYAEYEGARDAGVLADINRYFDEGIMFSVVNATNRIRSEELEELAKEISLDRADNKDDKLVVKFSQATPDERKSLVTAISRESNGTQAELSSRAESIQNMTPVRIDSKPVSREDFSKIINNNGNEVVVEDDGMHVSFSGRSVEKMYNEILSETGAASEIVKLLEGAKYAYSQPHNNAGTLREDGTPHPIRENVLEYRNYVNKFTNDDGTYYIRFVVMPYYNRRQQIAWGFNFGNKHIKRKRHR